MCSFNFGKLIIDRLLLLIIQIQPIFPKPGVKIRAGAEPLFRWSGKRKIGLLVKGNLQALYIFVRISIGPGLVIIIIFVVKALRIFGDKMQPGLKACTLNRAEPCSFTGPV